MIEVALVVVAKVRRRCRTVGSAVMGCIRAIGPDSVVFPSPGPSSLVSFSTAVLAMLTGLYEVTRALFFPLSPRGGVDDCAERLEIAGIWWLVAAFQLIWGIKRRKAEKMLKFKSEGRCLQCGYDIRQNSGCCPECGVDIGVKEQATDNPTGQRIAKEGA